MSLSELASRDVAALQSAFELIATLHLTAYMFPAQTPALNLSCYDYLIVGGGTSGCVLASSSFRAIAPDGFPTLYSVSADSQVAENPNNTVLLIEAGGRPSIETTNAALVLFTETSDKDWNYGIMPNNYTFQCQPNGTGVLFLGNMLGGTSSLSIELYQRGVPQDYDSWAKTLKDPAWAWKNVLPLFIKSEKLEDETIASSSYSKYHGYDGLFGVSTDPRDEGINDFLAAYKEVGHQVVVDVVGNGTLGYGKALLTIGGGQRSSSGTAFLGPAKNRKNLHILRDTLVTKILFNRRKRATSVKAVSGNRTYIFRAKKEVIVCAGPVKSPQLLMLSGIGPKKHLLQKGIKPIMDLPVGEHLQDHNTVILSYVLDNIPGSCDETCYDETFNPTLYTAPVYVGKVSLDKSKKTVTYTTVNYIVPTSVVLPFCSFYYRYRNGVCENLYTASRGKQLLFVLVTLARPKSKGFVKLRNRDPFAAPIIDPGYFSDEEDMRTMIDSIKDYNEILKSSYFRKYNGTFVDVTCPRCKGKEGDEFWSCYARCVMKPMSQLAGACGAGRVLDSRLRVRRAAGLRVVDASSMPHLTSDDTVAPTIMIAENAAIMIQQDNQHGCDKDRSHGEQ